MGVKSTFWVSYGAVRMFTSVIKRMLLVSVQWHDGTQFELVFECLKSLKLKNIIEIGFIFK